eukprot:s1070_g19.t1
MVAGAVSGLKSHFVSNQCQSFSQRAPQAEFPASVWAEPNLVATAVTTSSSHFVCRPGADVHFGGQERTEIHPGDLQFERCHVCGADVRQAVGASRVPQGRLGALIQHGQLAMTPHDSRSAQSNDSRRRKGRAPCIEERRMSDHDVTSLVLRSSRKLSYAGVLGVLDELLPDAYDFVYLPWPKLAIVNFTSSQNAQLARRLLEGSRHGELDIRTVKEAIHQGLAKNLAVYCSKEDWRDKEEGAPRIFAEGRQIALEEALEIFVSDELLEQEEQRQTHAVGTEEAAPPEGVGLSQGSAQEIIYVNGPIDVSQIPPEGDVIFRL